MRDRGREREREKQREKEIEMERKKATNCKSIDRGVGCQLIGRGVSIQNSVGCESKMARGAPSVGSERMSMF
jgi:hypothetical protein